MVGNIVILLISMFGLAIAVKMHINHETRQRTAEKDRSIKRNSPERRNHQ